MADIRADRVPSVIDGRPAVTDDAGYTKPVRAEHVAEQYGLPLSPFPHQSPGGHQTDVITTGELDTGHLLMRRVKRSAEGVVKMGSKFTAHPETGVMFPYRGGAADTSKPMFPPLSPRTRTNPAPRFDSFEFD